MDLDGNYYALELAADQSLEALYAFGDRLHELQEALR